MLSVQPMILAAALTAPGRERREQLDSASPGDALHLCNTRKVHHEQVLSSFLSLGGFGCAGREPGGTGRGVKKFTG